MEVSLTVVILTLMAMCCAQLPIPSRPLGFVYNGGSPEAQIHLDAYLDLECPDSQAAFPTLKQVADHYGANVTRLNVFVFPLPYHRNAFLAAQATQIVSATAKNMSADDAAYAWMKLAFDNQENWSTYTTFTWDQGKVEMLMASYAKNLGFDPVAFYKLFDNPNFNMDARIMWKYACTRGVAATPWFMINGITVEGDGSWTLDQWKAVIDPLLKR